MLGTPQVANKILPTQEAAQKWIQWKESWYFCIAIQHTS